MDSLTPEINCEDQVPPTLSGSVNLRYDSPNRRYAHFKAQFQTYAAYSLSCKPYNDKNSSLLTSNNISVPQLLHVTRPNKKFKWPTIGPKPTVSRSLFHSNTNSAHS